MIEMSEELSPYRDASAFYLGAIAKIAAAAGCTPTSFQVQVYLERLEKLTFEEMTRAAQRTMEEWDYAGKMPPLPYIVQRAYLSEPERSNPAPWKREETTEDERLAIIEEGRERLEVVKAALRPKDWPAYREAAEKLKAQRNGPSQIPEDKEERRLWGIRKAREILGGERQ